MDWISMFFLHLCQEFLVRVIILRVLSIANLIVLKNSLNVRLHVRGEARVMVRSDSPCKHLIQVKCLKVDLFLLTLPFFR